MILSSPRGDDGQARGVRSAGLLSGSLRRGVFFFLAWQSTPGGEKCWGEELMQSRELGMLSGLLCDQRTVVLLLSRIEDIE